jgi:hypothetical protein
VDPAGGADPTAAGVEWSQDQSRDDWTLLAVRVTAPENSNAVTVFLEIDATTAGPGVIRFDRVELLPYPCPIKECKPEPLPVDERLCVNWADEKKPRTLGIHHEKLDFVFDTDDRRHPLRIVFFGPAQGLGMLYIPPSAGVRVQLPFTGQQVIARVVSGTSKPIRLEALDVDGNLVGSAMTPPGTSGTEQILTVSGAGIAYVWLRDGGGEGALIELCVARSTIPAKRERPTFAVAQAHNDLMTRRSKKDG